MSNRESASNCFRAGGSYPHRLERGGGHFYSLLVSFSSDKLRIFRRNVRGAGQDSQTPADWARALLVRDYDEAKGYYTNSLGFELIEDGRLADGKCRLLVEPLGSTETGLLHSKADPPIDQSDRQAVRRQGLLVSADRRFGRDFNELTVRGVRFCEAPLEEEYGTVAEFEDLYANNWDLRRNQVFGLTLQPLTARLSSYEVQGSRTRN